MPPHKLSQATSGVFIISATPFTDAGALDLESTDRLLDFYVERGVSGITILGMMGEAHKLSKQEARRFLSHVLARVGGRLPVVVGVSNPDIDELASLAKLAMDQGAAGAMVAPRPGLTDDEQLYAYFARVFEALGTHVPVVYQDYPFVTKVETSVAVFNRMLRDFPQLVLLKHEACPGLNKISALRQSAQAEGLRRVAILVGNGGLYLPQELARGADGAMTGFAFPEMLVEVVRLFAAGQNDAAEDLFDAYLPLVRHEQQPGLGLALRKETLKRRGVIRSAKVRDPGPSLNAIDHAELSRLIERVERGRRRLGY